MKFISLPLKNVYEPAKKNTKQNRKYFYIQKNDIPNVSLICWNSLVGQIY